MLKLVLFDFDDTLFNHVGTVDRVYSVLSSRYPVLSSRPLQEVIAYHHQVLEEMHPDILRGLLTVAEGRRIRNQKLFAYCGSTLTDEQADAFTKESRLIYVQQAHLNDGAQPLLASLHGCVKIGVVSNNIRAEQIERMQQLEIDSYVDFLVAYDDVQSMKPEPPMIQRALDLAGVTACETVLVGNSWETDVEAALVFDMRAIWLTITGTTDNPNVTVVRSLSEVLGVLGLANG